MVGQYAHALVAAHGARPFGDQYGGVLLFVDHGGGGRRNADVPTGRAPQRLCGTEAGVVGDGLDGIAAFDCGFGGRRREACVRLLAGGEPCHPRTVTTLTGTYRRRSRGVSVLCREARHRVGTL
ncbi:hypothetical protein ACIP4Y_32225 [Streptomyces sp. NPDC088810]|uniref:hypothetical protein n=1 Tax=Streptomyces sp. NPDC088810 TaxID=3365904 RepID=UPI00380096C5